MANCPKCNKKIPFYHLGQLCPHCGVNVRFYNFDKNFYRDAKRAELSVAKTNIFIAHLKASLIGSKLTIIRLCIMILPLVSLLAPYAYMLIKQPFVEESIPISALGIYKMFSSGYLNYVMTMTHSVADASGFISVIAAVAGIIAIAVVAVPVLLLSVLSFTSIKKMPKILAALCITGMVFTLVTLILSFRFISVAGSSKGSILSGNISFGYVLTFIAFLLNLVVNLMITKKGYNIVYKEGDLERAEIARKVKAGEIKIDDLPQPIVETEETRQIDLEIARQQALYREKEGGTSDEEV
ncbi:MAG: hypothetical protein K6F64_02015 [Clostridia bacterium]|nr:hypothetical protein [Clostridia bacterium]